MKKTSLLRLFSLLLMLSLLFPLCGCFGDLPIGGSNTTTTPSEQNNPNHPEEPEQPEQPEQPEDPEQPEQPEQPEDPEQPEQPEEPAKPAYEVYTVTFKDENGNILETADYLKGQIPSYTYEKKDTAEWDYTVKGWSAEANGDLLESLPPVTADTIYYAKVTRQKIGPMKVEFFGTSHGSATDIRYSTSIMVEVNGARYIFDAGAPVSDIMLRKHYDLSSIKGVFISHSHGDHINGLMNLADVSQWTYPAPSYNIYLPDQNTKELLDKYNYTGNHRGEYLNITTSVFKAGVIHEDENIKVTAVAVDHLGENWPTYGFLIEGGGKKIFYTGDMSYDMHDFPAFLYETKVDLLITEFAHQTKEDMLAHLQRSQASKIVLNHVYPLEKAEELMDIAGFLAGRMYIVADNDIIYP